MGEAAPPSSPRAAASGQAPRLEARVGASKSWVSSERASPLLGICAPRRARGAPVLQRRCVNAEISTGGGSCWWESSPCGCLGALFAHRVTLAFSHRDAEGSSTLPVPHPQTKSLLETPSSCNPIPASSVLLPGPAQGCGNRFVRAPCQAELQKGVFFFPFPRRDDNSHTSTAF